MFFEWNMRLADRKDLTPDELKQSVVALLDETVPTEAKVAFLVALARKGETPNEISAFASEVRSRAIELPVDPRWRASREILDVCGTGGDRLNTFNISTTVGILCAAAGVVVAKHGNRAVTSQSGSADVLEALGISVDLSPEEAVRSLQRHGFAFFFAPKYHPAFRHVAAARKLCAERGQRTIFNYLGPLLNPARPSVQLLGVARPDLCDPLARTLQSLGLRRAMVVCGEVPGGRYLDELSTLGSNHVAEFHHDRGFSTSTWTASDFPLQIATLADIAGGDRIANAEIIRRLVRGDDRGPRRDAVLLNAAAGLFLAGRVRNLVEGWDLAGRTIDSGAASEKLAALQEPIV
ncbi:MAG: anthranilate phosphoribosyltransferase [Pedosphaera sp.]|nr:anthranilate phosphoribosyltransferase [Pedosphaera sp.]